MPVHASLPCETANWTGEPNLQNNKPRGEKKRQLDGFPVESVFSNILCCQQPEMVLGVAVQKDGQIL